MNDPGEITTLLRKTSSGDSDAEQSLMAAIYRDLRRLAGTHLRRERLDHTLQATALVHEAYFRLFGATEIEWQDRSHFFRVAATVMRRILVDHARRKRAGKRGGVQIRITMEETAGAVDGIPESIIDLDRALNLLAEIDQRQAKIVELRYFGGVPEEEVASLLGISVRTVKREWAIAKAWLRGQLRP